MLKCGGFAEGYEKTFPAVIAVAGAVSVTVTFIMLTAFAVKKAEFIKYGLGAYLVDSAFLLYAAVADPFGDVSENIFIDIIFHFLTVLLLCVGIYAEKKLKKSKSLIHKATGVN